MDNRQEIPRNKVRILSRSHDSFFDRAEAGRLLAAELTVYKGQSPVILGIPRGGIIVARELAQVLGGPMDVVVAHKLGTPGQQELAMGSVAEDGKLFLNESVTTSFGISRSAIETEREKQLALIKRRTNFIRKVRPKVSLKDRVVIITDDGVATGSTTQAAIWAVKTEQPQKMVLAIPVGPEDTLLRLAEYVDEVVCLRSPPAFAAVGQFYRYFYPVEDEDMLRVLAEEAKK
jgi:putative phosphoribosyl transferase